MCKVYEKTYVYYDGSERTVEKARDYCHKSNRRNLCNSYERIIEGPVFHPDTEPSLVHETSPSTSSAGFPSTPASMSAIETREPSRLGRQASTKGKLPSARKLKLFIGKGDSKRDSHHKSGGSTSSGSGIGHIPHSDRPSAGVMPPAPTHSNCFSERRPSSSLHSPDSPNADRRQRYRPNITHNDLRPSPPPGSTSGGSSLSGYASSMPRDEVDAMPTIHPSERRHAEDVNDQERRERRRKENAAEKARRDAEEQAMDEQSMREYNRINGREELRRQKRAAEEAQRKADEMRFTLPSYGSGAGPSSSSGQQNRRSSRADHVFAEGLGNQARFSDE
ncbi:MAG: hypothetical protein INR71_01850, partial [Terriglobus roseus]|nr:hypothetical protein [Terriglobus roseus]